MTVDTKIGLSRFQQGRIVRCVRVVTVHTGAVVSQVVTILVIRIVVYPGFALFENVAYE